MLQVDTYLKEFYLQQSRKEGGGGYAAAWAILELLESINDDEDGLLQQLYEIRKVILKGKGDAEG